MMGFYKCITLITINTNHEPAFYEPPLNRIVDVQKCDLPTSLGAGATMPKRVQMLSTKNEYKKREAKK
jgi:hypothetical protein